MRRLYILLLMGAALLGSCAGEDFAPEGELGETRLILDIQAEPPLAKGGEQVTFRALTHWPDSPATKLWLLCLPNIESGVFDEAHTCVANNFEAGGTIRLCTDLQPPPNVIPIPCILGQGEEASLDIPLGLIPSGVEAFFYLQLVVSSAPDVFAACEAAIAEGIPEPDCQIGVKQVPVVSEDSTAVNSNPAIASIEIDGSLLDATEVREIAPTDATPFFLLKMETDPDSIDEIIPSDGEPKSIYLDVKIYTDCGKLEFWGEREPFVRDGGYRREQLCEDPADGSGPTCKPIESKWIPNQSGECKVVYAVWDLFGGTTWREQHFIVTGF